MRQREYIRANAGLQSLRLEGASEGFELLASEESKPAKFAMTAYTGAAMKVGFGWPVVVDLSGMEVPSQARPILMAHDMGRIVGHSDSVEVTAQRIKVTGLVSGVGEDAQNVVAMAKRGFPWQASIGASVERLEFIDRGEKVSVNGRSFTGPLYVARKTVLGEVSFVPLGADGNTSATVAAGHTNGGDSMQFEAWLKAKGFDIATLTDAMKATLKAAFDAEQAGTGTSNNPGANPPAPAVSQPDPVADYRAQVAAEAARVAEVRRICAENGTPTITVNNARVSLEAHAIAQGWDATRTELEAVRANRATINVNTPSTPAPTGEVLEAALALSGRIASPERFFQAPTLEAANRLYRRGIGLQELLVQAASMNGYTGRGAVRSDLREILQAAFSSMSLPGILSNNANKFLLQGFLGVDQTWGLIASRRPVGDFKTITSYRLNGAFTFDEMGPGGEIPHGDVSEDGYTNKASTYGKMFAVTRQDIINDDLGALTALPTRIGRGAALKLNGVFWTAFLDNSSFFTSGNSNYISGATTVLASEGLRQGVEKFRKMTDPDGQPLAVTPKFLVVPPELEAIADELYTSTNINTGGAATTEKVPNRNTFAGKYQPVVVPYLSNTSYTGYSTTAWYLIADPMDIPVIEVVFLNGVETPTVETADADFSTLGIQMRGYFDFGVAKQDYRGGIKSKGAA